MRGPRARVTGGKGEAGHDNAVREFCRGIVFGESPVKVLSKKVMSKLSQKTFFSKMFPCSLDYAFFQRDYTLSLFSALGSVSEVYVSMVRDLRLPRLMYLRSTPFSKGLHNFLKLSCHDKPSSRETSSYTDIGIMS